ncbi:O-antigen ligase family protein [Ulvibacter antarcticus]|uniref:O-antigen ligase n=1 Tax=Ulvibacter antarcticus TaxID=442714 RepID=A0A3L9Z1H9_9FLAO|nr:O-antigen ligase family protein [Ulvibacter antarcticus]RMA65980.1 O-antigen ligase [Ulvibacter antarcticus]
MTHTFQNSKTKIADYSFLTFFAVLPFVDVLSPIVLGIALVLALFFKSQKGFLKRLAGNRKFYLLFFYFLLATVSLSYSQDFPESFKKLSRLIAFILVPLLFLLVNPSNELIEKAKKVFLYALIAFCAFSLLKLGYNYIVNFDNRNWYNFLQDSMYHKYMPEDAMYLNTGLVFLLFGNYSKNFKLFIGILFLSVIVLFAVRLGLFVYVLIIAVYFISNIKTLFNLRSVVTLIGIVLFSIVLINQSRYANDKFYDTLQKIGFNTGDQVSEIGAKYHKIGLREKIWTSSIDLIKERPILGRGAGVEKKPLAIINKRKGYDIPPTYNSHNQFLSVIIQYGVFGITWLLIVFILLFRTTIKNKNLPRILIVVVMFISMITESYLELQQGLFYFCVITSLLIWNPVLSKSTNK